MKISHLYAVFLACVSVIAVQDVFAVNSLSREVDRFFLDQQKIRYPASFSAAKRLIYSVYQDNQVDQYCGCTYVRRGTGAALDISSCGYEIRRNPTRANRIEIEHVVPAENLGRQFSCWREGGRDHCNATDKEFRNAHNDLHNLMPVIGEVNADRSNYRFDMIAGQSSAYGACDFKVDQGTRRAEPADHIKGDVARIHFYMRDQHGLRLSQQQERLFDVWSRLDPVDIWELIRDKRIREIQGNANPYVSGLD